MSLRVIEKKNLRLECERAIETDNINRLKAAHNKGVRLDPFMMFNAAFYGSPRCMQYMHAQGAGMHEDICAIAAQEGHLSCLQFAHEHGARMGYEALESAVCFNREDCAEYIQANLE